MLKEKIARNKKKVAVAGLCVLLLGAAGVSAFFTDSHSITNLFTVGGVTSELTEPLYDAEDPAERQLIGPGKAMTKDPQVTNKDTLDMYTFLKVSVPVKEVKTYNPQTKAPEAAALQPLFTWTVNDSWTEVKLVKNAEAWDYYYAYGSASAMTKIAPQQTTTPLFKDNQITFINVIEGQNLENTSLEVPVTDLSIQTTDLGTSVPAEILEIILNQRGQ